jgi:hypothetical protein
MMLMHELGKSSVIHKILPRDSGERD